jgi:hypothetical protein
MVNNYETISSEISNLSTSLFSPTQLYFMNTRKQINMCLLTIQFNWNFNDIINLLNPKEKNI